MFFRCLCPLRVGGRFRMGLQPLMQVLVGALGRAQPHPCRNPFDRQGRFRRSRAASANLPGSVLRRFANSDSSQPRRRSSSAIIRPALTSALSCRNAPEWCSPLSPSIRSSICCLKVSLPDTSHGATVGWPFRRLPPPGGLPSGARIPAGRRRSLC